MQKCNFINFIITEINWLFSSHFHLAENLILLTQSNLQFHFKV